MKKILQILGPTGMGKSNIAIEIARVFNGEVISADSMQVYRHFNIGTAKITSDEMKGVKHHLIDIINDCSQFNVKKFLTLSFKIVESLVKAKKLPVVCGGTALYLKSMLNGIFPENETKRISRDKLKKIGESSGYKVLWERLRKIDPEYAFKIGENDKTRIIRGLEIFYNNGIIPSEIFLKSFSPFSEYSFIRIGLNEDRNILYRKIEKRVDLMIKSGLIEEVRNLKAKLSKDCPPFSSIGYKEVSQYLDGEIELNSCIELIKQHSRNFAKRQLTWFRKEKDIVWFKPDQKKEIFQYISGELNR